MNEYLDQLEAIATNLGLKSFSREESAEWAEECLKGGGLPSIESIESQWSNFNPDLEGDPFNILTFWENQRQAGWDSSMEKSIMFPKSPDYAFGYFLLMGNIK